MELPTNGDFLYEELVKADTKANELEEHNALLRVQNDRALKSRDNLWKQKNELYDIAEYLRKHLAHTLANEPSVVKATAIHSFDARYDCRRCASDWASLVRFRECGGKL